jgi:hypothetical protein
MKKTLRQSGVVLGTFEADADGDAGAAFTRASAIDARLAAIQAERAKILRDPNLIDAAERQAALAKLAAAEHERLTEDAVFLAGARARAAAWRTEMLEGSPGDDATVARQMEIRRQFGALAEGKRADVLTKALDRKSPRDLGLLRALIADELTNEGLAGTLAAYRAPIERLVLELADPEGLTAWEKTNAQLDEFASAQALALRYVAEEPHLTPHERERRAADEAAAKGFIFNDRT